MKEHGRHIPTIMRLILFAICVNAAVQHLDVVAHAFSISALVMALIPILGAWVSAIVSAILVLASDGLIRALGFVVLIIVLQQIEGNIIYPRVMGNRVGLPSLWVLAAITLGSALMGVWGMLLFVPLFAVVYQLIRDQMHSRQEMKSAQ